MQLCYIAHLMDVIAQQEYSLYITLAWHSKAACDRSFVQVARHFAVGADVRDTEILERPVETVSWC